VTVGRSPYAILGLPEGSSLDACADALSRALAGHAALLVAAHAEDRPADVERFAELVGAWRALTPAAPA
jgi:hypothetical protein